MKAISIEQGKLLNQLVSDLLVQSEANCVLLTDIGGNVIACAPGSDGAALQTIAALSAGSFSATRELAVMTGETTFNSAFHQGKKTDIYIHSIGEVYLILVVFHKTTTIGLVKLYTEKVVDELSSVLRAIDRQDIMDAAQFAQPFELDESCKVFA